MALVTFLVSSHPALVENILMLERLRILSKEGCFWHFLNFCAKRAELEKNAYLIGEVPKPIIFVIWFTIVSVEESMKMSLPQPDKCVWIIFIYPITAKKPDQPKKSCQFMMFILILSSRWSGQISGSFLRRSHWSFLLCWFLINFTVYKLSDSDLSLLGLVNYERRLFFVVKIIWNKFFFFLQTMFNF